MKYTKKNDFLNATNIFCNRLCKIMYFETSNFVKYLCLNNIIQLLKKDIVGVVSLVMDGGFQKLFDFLK